MNNIRNFSVISHVDHGKSTLADRFLELTGTVSERKMRPQYLDMMDLERERGITIKMQPVRMIYKVNHAEILNSKSDHSPFSMGRVAQPQIWGCGEILNKSKIKNSKFKTDSLGFSASDLPTVHTQGFANSKQEFILNLIDTPGHIDFNYEVSRSLAAVEGAILLVDATQGIQAQTISNLELAKKQNLVIIPAINKIDMDNARVAETKEELSKILGINKEEVIEVSAKYGTNVEKILEAIINKIPRPSGDEKKPFRGLIFDSEYDHFKGVIAYVRVVDGRIGSGDKIYLMKAGVKGEIKELGYFKPEFSPAPELKTGEIGYIATGIKESGKVRVGDTITVRGSRFEVRGSRFEVRSSKFEVRSSKFEVRGLEVEPLPGYQEPKPMIFASIYPENSDDYDLLKDALNKLKLNDASLTFEPETREVLGRGFRSGFLGSLHAEIISERLRREFNLNLVISTPSVIYKIIDTKGKEIFIYSVSAWPDESRISSIEEPWVKLEVITPVSYLGRISELLKNSDGRHLETRVFGIDRLLLIYEVPLREIIVGFYDNLKSASQGYASMNYELIGYRPADLVRVDILIAGRKEEAFSKIVPRDRAYQDGSAIVKKLKEVLPAQLFSVALQAAIGGKIIARETIRARGRDVIAPLYGGDYTRKRKLLEKQKKGKKELKEKGEVRIPTKVFLDMFRR